MASTGPDQAATFGTAGRAPGPCVDVLGPLRVVGPTGDVAELGGRFPRLVLATLVAGFPHQVSTHRLIDTLWGASLPADPAGALQTHVSRLRRALAEVGCAETVATTPAGYRLAVDPAAVDAKRFAAAVDAAALAHDPYAARSSAEQALALWRGPPYDDLASHDPLLEAAGAALEELRLAAMAVRARALLDLGDDHGAAVAATDVLHARREHEGALEILARAHYRSGRATDALAALAVHRDRLAERGLQPAPALCELETAVLRHDLRGAHVAPTKPVTVPAGSLVGRDADVQAVADRLRRHRFVTLVGPGGVGKTRLARHAAAALCERDHRDSVFVDLSSVRRDKDVVEVAAGALALHERSDTPLADRVVGFLAPLRVLIVLDNCEHIVAGAATLVGRLVEETGALVLATSRQPLAVPSEHVWDVEPLSPDSATELFLDRMEALCPRLDRKAEMEQARAIAALVAGLPLGIELAASQSRTMSLEEIQHSLGERPLDLTHRIAPRDTRHASLEAAIRWSHDLLDPGDAEVSDRLCFFVSPFDLAAAHAVAAPDSAAATVDKVVRDLADRSLLISDPSGAETRFSTLEPLRHFGLARLAERGEGAALQRRHAGHFVSRAEQAHRGSGGGEEVRWVRRLEGNLADLRAAHRWLVDHDADGLVRLSAALHWFSWPGMRSEVSSWAITTADVEAATGHPLLPAVLGAAAVGTWQRGDLPLARDRAERGLTMVGEDDPRAAIPRQALGDVAMLEGRLEDALVHYRAAIVAARAAGDRAQATVDAANAALALGYAGHRQDAAAAAHKSVTDAEALGAPSVVAWAHYATGEVLCGIDPAVAGEHLDAAIGAADRVGARFVSGVAGLTALTIETRNEAPMAALHRYPGLLHHWRRAGAWVQLWATLRTLIEALVGIGADEPAMLLHGAARHADRSGAVYGDEARRLEKAEAQARARAGDGRVEEWIATGTQLGGETAAVQASQWVDRILGRT